MVNQPFTLSNTNTHIDTGLPYAGYRSELVKLNGTVWETSPVVQSGVTDSMGKINHTISEKYPGIYYYKFNLPDVDHYSWSNMRTITVLAYPVAAFDAAPRSGSTPLKVTFMDNSTGDKISSEIWQFKLNSDSTWTRFTPDENSAFTFANAGTYDVKLTVTGTGGSDAKTMMNYIYVIATETPNPAPLSVTAISPSTGTNDKSISATVRGTGFKPGAIVKFTLTGQPDIVASSLNLTGNSLMTCNIDLTGKPVGTWDLAVTNPSDGTNSVRSKAFTLTAPLRTNANGTIVVSSTPQDALVYLDGSLRGTGSVTLQDISPGSHLVRVSKTLYNDYGTNVSVSAGSISYVNAVLTPASGTVIALSNPANANVYFDGMDKGISPVVILGVSPGSHTVSFTKNDYLDESRTVTVPVGQTMEISVNLTKTGGESESWLNTTTLIIIGIIVVIIAVILYFMMKKKNRWENY